MLVEKPEAVANHIVERSAVDPVTFEREIAAGDTPIVLRGQAADWPAIAAARAGDRAMAEYLVRFDCGYPLTVKIAPPEAHGRFFYSDDMQGFNFRRQQVPMPALLAELVRLAEEGVASPHGIYADAAAAPDHFPGWTAANPLTLATGSATPRLWLGNATQVATHYDGSTNIAVVLAGRRRFTLFPPEQTRNLYVGPLDRTLAGPPVSMVDPEAPDLDRYPLFSEALRHAQVAELEPGDALFIPSYWWHHVRALTAFNVLVNYWWEYDPRTTPFLAMVHGLLSVRDLPPVQKRAVRAWFDHFVFTDDPAQAGEHLPEHARGVLGSASEQRTEQIIAYLIGQLAQRR
jgi:hypothetical protein